MTLSFFHGCLFALAVMLLVLGFFFEVRPAFESPRPKPPSLWAREGLWGGTAALVVSIFIEFLQPSKSVFTQDGPWDDRRFLGLWTALVFAAISVWRHFAGRGFNALLVLVWLSGFWVLGQQILVNLRWGGH